MHNTKLTHKPFLLYTGTIDDCRAHLINNGITVNEDKVTIEWQGTGPGANVSPPLGFECRIRDVTKYEQCMFVEESSCPIDSEYSLNCTSLHYIAGTSPHSIPISGLSSGRYTIDIRHDDPGRTVCTEQNQVHFTFESPSHPLPPGIPPSLQRNTSA